MKVCLLAYKLNIKSLIKVTEIISSSLLTVQLGQSQTKLIQGQASLIKHVTAFPRSNKYQDILNFCYVCRKLPYLMPVLYFI